jgi:hypothetical protein
MTTTTIPPDNKALQDVEVPALMDVQVQVRVMHDAWWRVNDALRRLRGHDEDEALVLKNALDDLDALDRQISHLQQGVNRIADCARERRDEATLKALTLTHGEDAEVRARLAQADLNLSGLYQNLQALCHQSSESLVHDMHQTVDGAEFPVWDAEVHADLDYLLDESNPLYDELSNNSLAQQDPIFWKVTAQGVQDHARLDDYNWLGHKHPWMTHQGWLTHDVLEHNYGKHPRFGVAALLQTGTVWVEVHTVCSYAFDLHAGRFMAPLAES